MTLQQMSRIRPGICLCRRLWLYLVLLLWLRHWLTHNWSWLFSQVCKVNIDLLPESDSNRSRTKSWYCIKCDLEPSIIFILTNIMIELNGWIDNTKSKVTSRLKTGKKVTKIVFCIFSQISPAYFIWCCLFKEYQPAKCLNKYKELAANYKWLKRIYS